MYQQVRKFYERYSKNRVCGTCEGELAIRDKKCICGVCGQEFDPFGHMEHKKLKFRTEKVLHNVAPYMTQATTNEFGTLRWREARKDDEQVFDGDNFEYAWDAWGVKYIRPVNKVEVDIWALAPQSLRGIAFCK